LAFSKSERYNKEVVGEHGGMSLPVGSFPKGKSFYGCHDMAGNVWEWCADWFETDYYKMKDAKRNPQGPSEEAAEEVANAKGKCRVLRGGSWVYGSRDCRAVSRSHYLPPNRIDHGCGFRVVVGD
jgi:formylglycine-generating enzyme required for sulfatase activity